MSAQRRVTFQVDVYTQNFGGEWSVAAYLGNDLIGYESGAPSRREALESIGREIGDAIASEAAERRGEAVRN